MILLKNILEGGDVPMNDEHDLRLAWENWNMAVGVARRWSAPDDLFEYLVDAARSGLLDSIRRFDPTRGITFQQFAFRRMNGKILDLLPALIRLHGNRRRAFFLIDDPSKIRVYRKNRSSVFQPRYIGGMSDPADSLIKADEALRVKNAVRELPEILRTTVIAYYWEDEKSRVIGERMGVSESMISRRLKQARELLRAQLSVCSTGLDQYGRGS